MSATDTTALASLVRDIVSRLHQQCDVGVVDNGPETPLLVSVQAAQNANLLIGKDGQNLRALEHVIRTIWKRQDPSGRQIALDVNDYKKTKVTELAVLVRDIARRVQDTRRPEAMNPMTAYERRIVHTELAAYHDLATESIGQEPHRRVVIKPL